ncbi:Protein CBG13437 [Caenorhabditis briggsae]|uniref:C-type LECtin n=2 Tax=Caenorhabditis briggsae TaxID=6238 RepID=A0AAE9DGQ1_CAEBR|nr:Protein CBG13437 [Caenorhabditis briggsae]ULU04161.1 hypothetical protein L3Y34_017150 [Caenorhabditis briggsae]CAP32184.2 Protein CBG13437 [Caenorhabditis briggsae]
MQHLVLLFAIFAGIFCSSSPICISPNDILVNNKCWSVHTTSSSHKDAVTTCAQNFGTLVTVKNAADNQAIMRLLGSTIRHLWLGLYCFQSDISQCQWDDASGSASDYNNFAPSFPYTDVGRCVYYATDGALAGQWISDDCDDDMRSFICETPTTIQDSCDHNFNGYCYYLSTSLNYGVDYNFEQAQETCESISGNLVSIHSPNELRYVKSLYRTKNTPSIYIGALTVSGKYHSWTDGSSWTFDNFDTTSQQSGNCMMMSLQSSGSLTQDAWYPSDCQVTRSFVCKRQAGLPWSGPTTPPTTVTPSPSNPSYCNSLLVAPSQVTSPGYPGNYTNNLNCAFQLATLGSYRIRLTFNSFNTESCCDKVTVYDGDDSQGSLLGRYGGQLGVPFSLESTGNTMLVTFTTDGSVVEPGFSANFLSLI